MKLALYTRLLVTMTATLMATAADAAVTINITQSGSDVVATASGSLDLSGLTASGNFLSVQGIEASTGFIGLGTPEFQIGDAYTGLSGPSAFGPGVGSPFSIHSSTSAGDVFGFSASGLGSPTVLFENGYLSGQALSATASWLNQDFASLGLVAGQYVYSGGSETLTVNIGQVNGAVPEPATWAMMLLGFGCIGFSLRRQKNAAYSERCVGAA